MGMTTVAVDPNYQVERHCDALPGGGGAGNHPWDSDLVPHAESGVLPHTKYDQREMKSKNNFNSKCHQCGFVFEKMSHNIVGSVGFEPKELDNTYVLNFYESKWLRNRIIKVFWPPQFSNINISAIAERNETGSRQLQWKMVKLSPGH